MQIAALLFLVAAASATPFDPEGVFWDPPLYNDPEQDLYLNDYAPEVPQFGWFKGDQYDLGSAGQLDPDRAADWEDSYFGRQKANISGFVQDHLADASAFLAYQGDDQFDFQEWYNEQIENFIYDQEYVDYDNAYDKKEDMDDFKDHLDRISYEFLEAQNNDYNDFVSDTVNSVWSKAIDESQEIIERLREAGYELNEWEYQAGELYAKLLAIGCGSSIEGEGSYLPEYEDPYAPYQQRMLMLIDVTNADYAPDFDAIDLNPDVADYFGEGEDSPYQCKMSQIFWEYVENANELQGNYNGGHITTARKQNLERRQIDLKRAFSKLRRKWRSLRKQLDEAEENADHTRQEVAKLNKILANLLTVDDSYDGPLGGVAIVDGAKAARPRKLDNEWTKHEDLDFSWDNLYVD